MRILNIESCKNCPYKRIWSNDLSVFSPKNNRTTSERNDDVCSNYDYTVISDVDTIPEWCPLPVFTKEEE